MFVFRCEVGQKHHAKNPSLFSKQGLQIEHRVYPYWRFAGGQVAAAVVVVAVVDTKLAVSLSLSPKLHAPLRKQVFVSFHKSVKYWFQFQQLVKTNGPLLYLISCS